MHEVDKKWQSRWESAKLHQPPAGKGEKFYLTAAFPYPNSPQHIGHGRTYTTADIYARYMRMRGKNVLFPMAFHVTGTPVLAMAKRIAQKDEEILSVFEKIYGIPRWLTETLTDPKELVRYFSHEIESGMREMGYSIDWRRKFYSDDRHFGKFIEWQFAKLYKARYITKGEHPVPWCPVAQTAVGAHDTKGDIDPQIEETTGVCYPYRDGFIICSTYRPETIYGVTNLWINPKAAYCKAKRGTANYYISKEAFPSLSMQLDLRMDCEIAPEEMMKEKAKHPLDGRDIPILPASFVDPRVGTGIVMSVPAHAPYDYLALKDLGLLDKIKPLKVLALEGHGEFPAKDVVERMKVESQEDPKAQIATEELYRKEAHEGRMAVGEFSGLKGAEAKEKVRKKMIDEGTSIPLYEIQNGPIYSRYGGIVGVKIVRDQWFIDYGREEWKEKARECLSAMKVYPEKSRSEYEYTIGWLKHRACTRSAGLGTAFPFDKGKMIEALSDSTIYMAYYTISHLLSKISPDFLDEGFFDYVFLGLGEPPKEIALEAEEMRREFLYWYPLDSRHSATDLVFNHLTFFIFNHAAIFPKEHWPRQIVTNGFVLMDGKKMSKSMGNIIPIKQAVRMFGADVVRFVVVSGADLQTDTDFNRPAAEGVLHRMKAMQEALENYGLRDDEESKNETAYKWLLSKMHRRATNAPGMYESFKLRELSLELFYDTYNDVQLYLKWARRPCLREFFELWLPLIAPIMPHYAEEMWERLGKKIYCEDSPFVAVASFPKGDASKIHPGLEEAEKYLLCVKDDIKSIMRLIKKAKAEKIEIFVAAEWKRKLKRILAGDRKFDSAMKAAMADLELKQHASDIPKVLQSYMKNIGAVEEEISEKFEIDALVSGKALLEGEFGCPISVMKEEESAAPKAKLALPGKPSILVS